MCCSGPHGLPTLDHARSAPARRICRSRFLTGEVTRNVARPLGAYDVCENTAVNAGWSAVFSGTFADDGTASRAATAATPVNARITERPARASATASP